MFHADAFALQQQGLAAVTLACAVAVPLVRGRDRAADRRPPCDGAGGQLR